MGKEKEGLVQMAIFPTVLENMPDLLSASSGGLLRT